MLRFSGAETKEDRRQSLFRQVTPHIALVFLVTLYLLIGAKVFDHLERPYDQKVRSAAKIRLINELRDLISLSECPGRIEKPSKTAVDRPSTRKIDSKIGPPLLQDFEETGSGDFTELISDNELYNDARKRETQKLLRDIVYHWEDAVRTYDMRSNQLFKDDLISNQQMIGNHSNLDDGDSRWTFPASILFAFTIITTIGYGNITPNTTAGRLFCMIYGLVGIPLTMLAIANMGRFLSEGADILVTRIRREFEYRRLKRRSLTNMRRPSRLATKFFKEAVKKSEIDLTPLPKFVRHISLLSLFVLYVVLGALCLPLWEDMNFFDACYFSFVTITTVGFGDIVPKRFDYLFPTLVYITIGLALTTLTIEIFGGFLRQIHYLGSKIKGAKNVFVWFGNKMLTVQDLVTAVARQYGIPQGEIETLNENLDVVIEQTVEEKEIEMRLHKEKKGHCRRINSQLAPLFDDYEFRYIDDSTPSTPMQDYNHNEYQNI